MPIAAPEAATQRFSAHRRSSRRPTQLLLSTHLESRIPTTWQRSGKVLSSVPPA